MTVVQKTLYEGVAIDEITAECLWCVTVRSDENTYVELEYSAYLEDYLKTQLNGSGLYLGLTRPNSMPGNTVMNATVHTPSVNKLSFSNAVSVALDGFYSQVPVTLVLDDASTCRGGHFYGDIELQLSDASTCVEFSFEGANAKLEVSEASTFKGCLYASGELNVTLSKASFLTNYWGEINHVTAEVVDASSLNMSTNFINSMYIAVKSASEATVNVEDSLEGLVQEASKLYYSGDPVLHVDCDETSILQQVDYPNPDK